MGSDNNWNYDDSDEKNDDEIEEWKMLTITSALDRVI